VKKPMLALAVLLAVAGSAVPAQAANSAPADNNAGNTAGVTWSQLMKRKIDLDTASVKLNASLPGLKAAVPARNADLVKAQMAETTASVALAGVTVKDAVAKDSYAAAKTAAAAAKAALTAAQKAKSAGKAKVAAAQKALDSANALVKTRNAALRKAWDALLAARTTETSSAAQVATATTAIVAANQAVADTQQKITAMPGLVASVAAQASALSRDVVDQSRAAFTTADTTKVYGITVNKIVAYPFQHLIDDAAKAGVKMSGGGFRTREQQIALRTTNGCPDVWTAPASSCRVPTAIPGRSLHELGLAIDLSTGGKTIGSRTSPAYKWLAANAGKYGFVNLPSEPWHWSITGS
jgi:D-alanyl-D-alanine carboxypeptidase